MQNWCKVNGLEEIEISNVTLEKQNSQKKLKK
jgi:hypothetical protein